MCQGCSRYINKIKNLTKLALNILQIEIYSLSLSLSFSCLVGMYCVLPIVYIIYCCVKCIKINIIEFYLLIAKTFRDCDQPRVYWKT